jgi:RNase II-type exonuclease C-terminal S1 domain
MTMPSLIRRVAPGLLAAVVAAGLLLAAGPALAQSQSYVDTAVEALRRDNVYVAPDAGGLLDQAAAERLRGRIGETFDAEVTGASPRGTYARLLNAPGEGRVVRGAHDLRAGQRIRVRLLAADPVHGFIDFARVDGAEPRKQARTRRKQRWARELADRVGERFDAVITGVTPKATWLRLDSSGIEGRLVRGLRGLTIGDRVPVVLLSADAERGYIDFARED